MVLELLAHPFAAYCWKALIALYENGTPFEYRVVDPAHPENTARLRALSPLGKFPLLLDGDLALPESTIIVGHLDRFHPGPVELLPGDPANRREARLLDRIFDNYVMTPMQKIVADAMRAEGDKDSTGVGEAHATLDTVYCWLDHRLAERPWAAGSAFTLADCAAAPSLFYADWVHPIPDDHARLKGYRARLLARTSVARTVDEARPYRHFFPPGAPDRD